MFPQPQSAFPKGSALIILVGNIVSKGHYPRNNVPPFQVLKWGDYRGAFRDRGCLFCRKTTSGRILMSTDRLYNEEALDEEMRAGRGCLFLRCSSKQTTSRGGLQPPSAVSAPRGADTIPVRGHLIEAWSTSRQQCNGAGLWQRLESVVCGKLRDCVFGHNPA